MDEATSNSVQVVLQSRCANGRLVLGKELEGLLCRGVQLQHGVLVGCLPQSANETTNGLDIALQCCGILKRFPALVGVNVADDIKRVYIEIKENRYCKVVIKGLTL